MAGLVSMRNADKTAFRTSLCKESAFRNDSWPTHQLLFNNICPKRPRSTPTCLALGNWGACVLRACTEEDRPGRISIPGTTFEQHQANFRVGCNCVRQHNLADRCAAFPHSEAPRMNEHGRNLPPTSLAIDRGMWCRIRLIFGRHRPKLVGIDRSLADITGEFAEFAARLCQPRPAQSRPRNQGQHQSRTPPPTPRTPPLVRTNAAERPTPTTQQRSAHWRGLETPTGARTTTSMMRPCRGVPILSQNECMANRCQTRMTATQDRGTSTRKHGGHGVPAKCACGNGSLRTTPPICSPSLSQGAKPEFELCGQPSNLRTAPAAEFGPPGATVSPAT